MVTLYMYSVQASTSVTLSKGSKTTNARKQGIKDKTILSYEFPNFDLSPVVYFIQQLGANSGLYPSALTRKLCFLLGITGFMRPSNLHRVDDNPSCILVNPLRLKLVVIAPN